MKAIHFRSRPSQTRRSWFSRPESNKVEEKNRDQPEQDLAAVRDPKKQN